ncbi:hypothetical protein SEVIR_4G128700v4 [Setaria viridis]|uniref:RanBP2-type domain-containing protein n=3 Tax=Setaria TaxID=4554 RepID=A0A368QV14_SETIT|nr:basic salivary proline-rich protein 2 [Setaria italica]XP_034590095.1 basic salivary proline-rich protein 2 [Setaria viridis]RCV21733.1 hypothetical protein SETIT_4G161500v2 [Setaria italica]TKW21581.1 hypothetical protein SEVIR_4G128700v2 [Setaria viridis]
MRPRGRGDDVDDEDDEDEYEDITPPRSTPEPEVDPAPAPSPSPAPDPVPALPQPARAPLSSLVVKPPPPPPQVNGGGSSPPSPAARTARSPSPVGGGGHRGRGASPPRHRRELSPPRPRGWERRRSPPPERRRPGSPPLQRRRFSPPPRFQPLRQPRFHDEQQGYGMHGGPSPPRPRRPEGSKFDDAGPRYTHGYQGGGRGGVRFREGSPPYGRGGRSYGRGYGAPPGKDFINIDGEYVHRNDPNLSPREGDWICQNPNCGNLNFARRTHCNNCNKFRYSAREAYEPRRSPPRGYPSPPPRGPPRMVGPPGDRAPPREMARYRSPPHGWGAGESRGYAARSPPERPVRFTDASPKERMGFRGERDLRDRAKFEWSATDDYGRRERPHDGYIDRSRRRSGSPRANWGNDLRDRSRSPPRNRLMKSSFTGRGRPDNYAADPYASRGRPNSMEAGHGRGHGYRPGGGPYPGEGRGDRRPAPRGRNEDNY